MRHEWKWSQSYAEAVELLGSLGYVVREHGQNIGFSREGHPDDQVIHVDVGFLRAVLSHIESIEDRCQECERE